jgi:hypothetical protein
MEINKNLQDKYAKKPKKSQFLHSPNHVLADELSQRFNEPKRFGFYLKMATMYDHNVLRRIAGFVLEGTAKKPGALFAYLIKKEKETNDSSDSKIS